MSLSYRVSFSLRLGDRRGLCPTTRVVYGNPQQYSILVICHFPIKSLSLVSLDRRGLNTTTLHTTIRVIYAMPQQ